MTVSHGRDRGRWLTLPLTAAFLLALCGNARGAPAGAPPEEPVYEGRSAVEWIEVMGSESGAAVAETALKTIGAPALPLLISTVQQHPQAKVRRGAARALGAIGGAGAAAALSGAIRRESGSDVGYWAATAMAALIEKGDAQAAAERPAVITALTAAIAAQGVRGQYAAQALAAFGAEGTRALLATLAASQDPNERGNAVSGLGWAKGAGIEEALMQALGEDATAVRKRSAIAISFRAANPKANQELSVTVPVLIKALKDPDAEVRSNAADALRKIGAGAREAVPALREASKDADRTVSERARAAVSALEAIPSTARSQIASATPSSATEAIYQGRKMDDWVKEYVTRDIKTHSDASAVLTAAGPQAMPALQAAATSYPDRWDRHKVVLLIGRLGGRGAAAALALVARTDPVETLRCSAAHELAGLATRGDLGAKALLGKMIPELIETLAKDPSELGAPVKCLSAIGAAATPALAKAARDHAADNVRQGAVFCLKQSKDPGVAPTLIHALKDKSAGVRSASIQSILWVVGTDSPHFAEIVSTLAASLKDPDEKVRASAARLLGEIGPAARSALPALREAAQQDPAVRYAAEIAIQKLE